MKEAPLTRVAPLDKLRRLVLVSLRALHLLGPADGMPYSTLDSEWNSDGNMIQIMVELEA